MHDYEFGWKDVVVIYSQETVRIIKAFEDYADPDGPYMSHCHILEHEDAGMMTHWVVVDQPTGIEDPDQSIPNNFSLNQNFPNPFNPTTLIQFSLPQDSDVRLIVFNLLGLEIAVLAEGEYAAGTYSVTFDGMSLASGVYLYQLVAGTKRLTRKLLFIK